MNTDLSTPVQPIVVVPPSPEDDVPSPHLSVIAAAAIAAGRAFLEVEPDSPVWAEWLAGSFTKSVRRATKPAKIAKVENSVLPHSSAEMDGARAFAFAPAPYSEWPKELSRLQVSGLDLRHPSDPDGIMTGGETASKPSITLSKKISMTTGKAAAQAAHALVAWLSRVDGPTRDRWLEGLAVDVFIGDADGVADPFVEIHDNGLTEIEPGTLTAVVLWSH